MYTFSVSVNAFSVEYPLACYQQAGRVWYVSGALRRTYTLFYPAPNQTSILLAKLYNSYIEPRVKCLWVRPGAYCWVGSDLTRRHYTTLERLTRIKHQLICPICKFHSCSSESANVCHKMFYKTGPVTAVIKHFTATICKCSIISKRVCRCSQQSIPTQSMFAGKARAYQSESPFGCSWPYPQTLNLPGMACLAQTLYLIMNIL